MGGISLRCAIIGGEVFVAVSNEFSHKAACDQIDPQTPRKR
jgi:hypothetical protein